MLTVIGRSYVECITEKILFKDKLTGTALPV
jgi:hypothetical protein